MKKGWMVVDWGKYEMVDGGERRGGWRVGE